MSEWKVSSTRHNNRLTYQVYRIKRKTETSEFYEYYNEFYDDYCDAQSIANKLNSGRD